VSLSSPGPGLAFASPASITVVAAADDADGQVTRVDIYAGSLLLASDTAAPYTVTWNAVPGSHALTAIAYDDMGASTTSAVVAITVNPPVRQWLVTFGLSADHATNVDGYVLELFTEGATAGTPLRRLEIGKPATGPNATVDMTALVTGLGTGRYVATISAVNMRGSSARVASAAFVR
jgi:chitinase